MRGWRGHPNQPNQPGLTTRATKEANHRRGIYSGVAEIWQDFLAPVIAVPAVILSGLEATRYIAAS
jgi:hypothetical protein